MIHHNIDKDASPTILFLGLNLRTNDNPALCSALARSQPVIAVFVLDDDGGCTLGSAGRWWLHHSLSALERDLSALNIPLILKRGAPLAHLQSLIGETGSSAIFWNRQYDQHGIAMGKALKQWAKENGVTAESFNASLLHEPDRLRTKAGGSFKVFTPFWQACLQTLAPLQAVAATPAQVRLDALPASDSLANWKLLPKNPDWARDFSDDWQPGERGALKALARFLNTRLHDYAANRDIPSLKGTSALSPHLRFGEISPTQIWHAVKQNAQEAGAHNADKFLSEIGWREFSHYLLYHHPHLETENFNPRYDVFPWQNACEQADLLQAWQRGKTGYPIVDAGMRELWKAGWMHNRIRMIVGSFLVKHLLIDWREGEKWFRDTLLDACPANNTAGWQWIAGCGADAAPYFRIFNPILQGEKFDPEGEYVRRFVPELSQLPAKFIHKPWTASTQELALCDVVLGESYPTPIVHHAFARSRALSAFNQMKQPTA